MAGNAIDVYLEVLGHVLRELGGVELPSLPRPTGSTGPIEASRYVGSYGSEVVDYVVTQDQNGAVWLDETPKGLLADMGAEPKRRALLPYGPDTLIVAEPTNGMYELCAFVGATEDGRAQYLHNGRAARRS